MGRRIGADEFAGCARAPRKHVDYVVRRWRGYAVLLALALVAAGSAVVLLPSREPVYGGKKLSEWVCRYKRGANVELAEDAIRHVGTN